MRMNRALAILVLLFSMLFFIACSEDENPMETQNLGDISGTITLDGTWPSFGNVQVSVWTSWPPMGPPAAFTAPLPKQLTQAFKIEGLSKGPYSVITVGWRDPNNPTQAKVLGVYWDREDVLGVDCKGDLTVQPLPIEISDTHPAYSNINIHGNLDIANLGEVAGTVNFVGTWPATGDVQVSLWQTWPPAGPPTAASAVFTRDIASQSYRIQCLAKGTYSVLTVGWRDPANPMGAKVLGIYWAQADSLGVDATGTPTAPPLPIEISDAKLNWSGVNIKANLDVVQ